MRTSGELPESMPAMPASPMTPAQRAPFHRQQFWLRSPGALTTACRVDLGTADQIMSDAVGVLSSIMLLHKRLREFLGGIGRQTTFKLRPVWGGRRLSPSSGKVVNPM